MLGRVGGAIRSEGERRAGGVKEGFVVRLGATKDLGEVRLCERERDLLGLNWNTEEASGQPIEIERFGC